MGCRPVAVATTASPPSGLPGSQVTTLLQSTCSRNRHL